MIYLLTIRYKDETVIDEVFSYLTACLSDLEDRMLDNQRNNNIMSWTISPLREELSK